MSDVPPISDISAAADGGAAPVPRVARTYTRTPEAEKTPEQRAEDIAYTINHAVSCATTDIFIVPTIAARISSKQWLGWKSYMHEAGHYLGGEIAGDFVAVPFTIFVQRHFPAFMESVARIVEPVAKPVFHHGAHEAAKRWGRKHGYSEAGPEVADRAEEIYRHEIDHLPQALVWNMFSFPLGVIGQTIGHVLEDRKNGIPIANVKGTAVKVAISKLAGTAISNVILIGARALLPDKAEKFDRMDGKYVIRPGTRAIGGLIGIDSKVVDRMDAKAEAAEQRENGAWQARVKQEPAQSPQPGL